MKQIESVLHAINMGAITSYDVQSVTGLSINHIASYLSQLYQLKCIERTGLRVIDYRGRGKRCHTYRPLTPRSQEA